VFGTHAAARVDLSDLRLLGCAVHGRSDVFLHSVRGELLEGSGSELSPHTLHRLNLREPGLDSSPRIKKLEGIFEELQTASPSLPTEQLDDLNDLVRRLSDLVERNPTEWSELGAVSNQASVGGAQVAPQNTWVLSSEPAEPLFDAHVPM